MLGSGGGELGGGNSIAAREGTAAVRSERAVMFCGLCSAGLYCVFPFSVSLLFLFPLFAVLLNCPYPKRPVSACFFPFSCAHWREEGKPRGAFVAGCSQTRTSTYLLFILFLFCLFSKFLNYFLNAVLLVLFPLPRITETQNHRMV